MAKAEIEKAIGTHALWKGRFKAALEARRPMAFREAIAADDQCDFGIWLRGPDLSAEERASEIVRAIEGLHAEFHRAAAQVVDLAEAHREFEVGLSVSPGGAFHEASAALLEALKAWYESLNEGP
ncbi:MAG: uncharacterized protein H6P99_637 [Holophagaceae bacterium]|nr:uncharacterized protein [Holophagaceae bacterium]